MMVFALLVLAEIGQPVRTAHATVILDPIVTFEGRTRQAAVRVLNSHPRVMTYRISIVNLRKLPDGSFVEVQTPDPDDRFASGFLEFSPRQTTIGPNQTQTIRLILRKPANLPPGEYRSYLRIAELPSPENPTPGIDVVMTLTHQFPIIVRN